MALLRASAAPPDVRAARARRDGIVDIVEGRLFLNNMSWSLKRSVSKAALGKRLKLRVVGELLAFYDTVAPYGLATADFESDR